MRAKTILQAFMHYECAEIVNQFVGGEKAAKYVEHQRKVSGEIDTNANYFYLCIGDFTEDKPYCVRHAKLAEALRTEAEANGESTNIADCVAIAEDGTTFLYIKFE